MAKSPSPAQLAARARFAKLAKQHGGKIPKGARTTSTTSSSTRSSTSTSKGRRTSSTAKSKKKGGRKKSRVPLVMWIALGQAAAQYIEPFIGTFEAVAAKQGPRAILDAAKTGAKEANSFGNHVAAIGPVLVAGVAHKLAPRIAKKRIPLLDIPVV